tara:strand:- start:3538 stop:4017 length:480 start_codon:yes stop_codon:yes gene_type:complete
MSIEIKEIKKVNPFQLSQFIEISNHLFGKGYHSKKYFSNKDIVTIVAFKKNKIIGFLIGKKEIKNMVIDCIAIKRSWQRKSIGTKLMTFYFQKFLSSKDKVVAYAWKIKNEIPAGKINYKFGLKPIKNMGKIWKEKCNVSFKCSIYKNTCICECIKFSN